MRRGWALLASMALSALLLLQCTPPVIAEGTVLMEDNFEGPTGIPDRDKWTVVLEDPRDSAKVDNLTLRLWSNSYRRVKVIAEPDIASHTFGVEFSWMMEGWGNHTLEVEVQTRNSGEWEVADMLYYDPDEWGWSMGRPQSDPSDHYRSGMTNAENGTWYRFHLLVKAGILSVSITDDGQVEPLLDIERSPYLKRNIRITLGQQASGGPLQVRFDDFVLYDTRAPSDVPLVVDDIPAFTVVEDEKKVIFLGDYVHDPDGDDSDVYVVSDDPHVTATYNKEVQVLCPEDGGSVDIDLAFTDDRRTTSFTLVLVVTNVNDPPVVNIQMPTAHDYMYDDDPVPLVFTFEDPDSSEWHTKWSVVGLDNTYYRESFEDVHEDGRLAYGLGTLKAGSYRIRVDVTDLIDDGSDSVIIEIGSTAPDEGSEISRDLACLVVILFFAIIVGVPVVYQLLGLVRRRGAKERTERLFADIEKIRADRKKAERPAPEPQWAPDPEPPEPEPTPPMAPAYASEPPPEPIVPELEERPLPAQVLPAGTDEWRVDSVQEFVDLIPDLPNGFPESLWGIPWEELGAAVVSTSTLLEDGTRVAFVERRAYHADKGDMSTFMQPLEG